jgi:hypothetical protein
MKDFVVSLGFQGGFGGGSSADILLKDGTILHEVRSIYSSKPIKTTTKTVSAETVKEIISLFTDDVLNQEWSELSNINNIIEYTTPSGVTKRWVYQTTPFFLKKIHQQLIILFY